MTQRCALQTRYTLRRYTASIMKDLIFDFKRLLKRGKVSILRRDSGNAFHILGDAYENIYWDLVKFILVTVKVVIVKAQSHNKPHQL